MASGEVSDREVVFLLVFVSERAVIEGDGLVFFQFRSRLNKCRAALYLRVPVNSRISCAELPMG